MITGIQAFLEILNRAGIDTIFGNPGTTELPLNDALAQDARFRYILGLHEVPVLAMADGFAMASGLPGVVNVHSACGLGNSLGMLYNAHCEGTPLVVTAGQQDRRLRLAEPVLEADLVQIARPLVKWAVEVQRVEDIPLATRRAIQVAQTPPTGPVFLSLPVDLQMESSAAFDLAAPHRCDPRMRPPTAALAQATELLAGSARPAILAGSRVTESGGCAALARLAEILGAPVFADSATNHGRVPLATSHPLYQGVLPLWSPDIQARLQEFDVLLIVGMNALRLYVYHEPARALPEHLRLVQLDNAPWQIGKNFAVDVGLIGDPACGLAELAEQLDARRSAAARTAAQQRIAHWAARRATDQTQLRTDIAAARDLRPMRPVALMGALANALPADVAVIEEAVTTQHNVLERLGLPADPAAQFAHRGWALGWGLGCALGVKLAWPDRPVLGLLGDGAAMYGIQGLWTAAHYGIGVTFVVCNNAEYGILKVCGDVMPLPRMAQGRYVGMDLVDPRIDFVQLARALGVDAQRVTEPDELTLAVATSLASNRPRLIEASVGR